MSLAPRTCTEGRAGGGRRLSLHRCLPVSRHQTLSMNFRPRWVCSCLRLSHSRRHGPWSLKNKTFWASCTHNKIRLLPQGHAGREQVPRKRRTVRVSRNHANTRKREILSQSRRSAYPTGAAGLAGGRGRHLSRWGWGCPVRASWGPQSSLLFLGGALFTKSPFSVPGDPGTVHPTRQQPFLTELVGSSDRIPDFALKMVITHKELRHSMDFLHRRVQWCQAGPTLRERTDVSPGQTGEAGCARHPVPGPEHGARVARAGLRPLRL